MLLQQLVQLQQEVLCWPNCRSIGAGQDGPLGEFQVQLNSEARGSERFALSFADSLDITHTPRVIQGGSSGSRAQPSTPRQQDLVRRLELPEQKAYPKPPGFDSKCGSDDREQLNELQIIYQEFALELHTGMYLTQLTSSRDYAEIHCQLMEDMTTLKIDQSNGRIIEFPLTHVSKVYRIVKSGGHRNPVADIEASREQIVVVEFMRRKLAFVFRELGLSQRFLICMELLIRRAQQTQETKKQRRLRPTFPPSPAKTCSTPRQSQPEPMASAGGISSPCASSVSSSRAASPPLALASTSPVAAPQVGDQIRLQSLPSVPETSDKDSHENKLAELEPVQFAEEPLMRECSQEQAANRVANDAAVGIISDADLSSTNERLNVGGTRMPLTRVKDENAANDDALTKQQNGEVGLVVATQLQVRMQDV